MIQFDLHIFFRWLALNHQLELLDYWRHFWSDFWRFWGKTIRCCWVQIAHSWLETKKSLFLQTHGLNPENRFHGKISHRMASCRKTLTWIHGFLFHWVPLVSAVYWRHFPSVGASPPGADWEGVGFIVVFFAKPIKMQVERFQVWVIMESYISFRRCEITNFVYIVPLVAASHKHRIKQDCQIWRLNHSWVLLPVVHLRIAPTVEQSAYSMMYLSNMTMGVMSIFVSTACFGFNMLHPREKALAVYGIIYIYTRRYLTQRHSIYTSFAEWKVAALPDINTYLYTYINYIIIYSDINVHYIYIHEGQSIIQW